MTRKIKLLDTFAGVGGFHLALEQSIGKENLECIGFSEIDKFAKQVYQEHFPNSKDLGDITQIDIENLPDFDLLTGGFPCQDVSVAGKQNLEEGGRTILVEYLLQILEKKKPKYFVFENVKGLMSKKFSIFLGSILDRIRWAGYDVEYQVLNTKDFGLPQNRERVFIVGTLNKVEIPKNGEGYGLEDFTFPVGQKLTTFLKDILEEEVDDKYYLSDKFKDMLERHSQRHKEKGTGFGVKFKELTEGEYANTLRANGALCPTDNIVKIFDAGHDTMRIYGTNGISNTLDTAQGGHRQTKICDGYIVRKLTPTEYERLQGFPDNRTASVSNSQRYKQMGNAISIPVVKSIFDNLLEVGN